MLGCELHRLGKDRYTLVLRMRVTFWFAFCVCVVHVCIPVHVCLHTCVLVWVCICVEASVSSLVTLPYFLRVSLNLALVS